MDPQRRHVPPSTYLNEDSSLIDLVRDATWRSVLVRDDLVGVDPGHASDMVMIISVLNLLARKVEDG
jgi:hypothetical protein